MNTDLTIGKESKVLAGYFVPMLLSVVFQQMYNIVDSVVAGKFIGAPALAAVGASYPITLIFMAVALGSNVGASVIISQLFGAKNFKKLKCAVSTSIIAVMALAVILTAAGLIFCSPLLSLMNTPKEIFSDSALYLNIYTAGLAFLFLYNISTGIFTALGDSKTPLYLLIASSLSNIALDIIFVAAFNMGVAGVAWATFLAQGVSSIVAFWIVACRIKSIKAGTYQKFSWSMLLSISRIVVPSILQQSFVSVGNLFIQSRVNYFGADTIAGYSAAVKLNNFTINVFATLGNAVSGFAAQNYGAGEKKRIVNGIKAGAVMAVAVAAIFFIAYDAMPYKMIGIFCDASEKGILEVGKQFLRITTPFYFAVSIKLMLDGSLRGTGRIKSFMTSTFVDLILRVIIAYALSYAMDSEAGIWLSWPIGWVIAAGVSALCYGLMYRKMLKE